MMYGRTGGLMLVYAAVWIVVVGAVVPGIQDSHQFVLRPGEGIVHSGRVVGDRHRLLAARPRLDHALLVFRFAAAVFTEVHFHPGQPRAEPGQALLQVGGHVRGQPFATGDVVVGVDLDLHEHPPKAKQP